MATVLNDKNYSKHIRYIYTHSPLIMSASNGTRYLAGVAVLNTFAVHDLNSLDAYTLHTVHEQDA